MNDVETALHFGAEKHIRTRPAQEHWPRARASDLGLVTGPAMATARKLLPRVTHLARRVATAATGETDAVDFADF